MGCFGKLVVMTSWMVNSKARFHLSFAMKLYEGCFLRLVREMWFMWLLQWCDYHRISNSGVNLHTMEWIAFKAKIFPNIYFHGFKYHWQFHGVFVFLVNFHYFGMCVFSHPSKGGVKYNKYSCYDKARKYRGAKSEERLWEPFGVINLLV